MSSIKSWRAVEEESWEPISTLGQQWMTKSSANNRGYLVMITDGCGLWGESRSAKYVLDKSDEWAPCIEAGIAELSKLVLAEMRKTDDATWENGREKVTLRISSQLNDMSYSWEFHLERLSDELFNHHWVTPLLVQFHQLGTRVKQLTTDLEKKQLQLEELLPDNKNSKNKVATKSKATPIETSVETVLSSGPWLIMQDQLTQYPQIMKNLHEIRDAEAPQVTNNTINNINNKRQTEVRDEEESAEVELQKQQERRAKIQQLTQGILPQASPQKKKKKKLNI